MAESLEVLEVRRAELLKGLAETGDMRQGSISENFRCCGKVGCRCAAANDPGHGPYYALTRKVGGKTKTLNLRPGPTLRKIEKEVRTYQGFRRNCQELVEVNEKICDARPTGESVEDLGKTALKKKLQRMSKRRSHKK